MFDFSPDEVLADDNNLLAESGETEQQLDDLPLEQRVQLAYGEADLGTRFVIYGGEILEIK